MQWITEVVSNRGQSICIKNESYLVKSIHSVLIKLNSPRFQMPVLDTYNSL